MSMVKRLLKICSN